MPLRRADDLDVRRPQTGLDRRRPRVGSRSVSGVIRLELHHPGNREQHRRVVRDEARGGDRGVAALDEELGEGFAPPLGEAALGTVRSRHVVPATGELVRKVLLVEVAPRVIVRILVPDPAAERRRPVVTGPTQVSGHGGERPVVDVRLRRPDGGGSRVRLRGERKVDDGL